MLQPRSELILCADGTSHIAPPPLKMSSEESYYSTIDDNRLQGISPPPPPLPSPKYKPTEDVKRPVIGPTPLYTPVDKSKKKPRPLKEVPEGDCESPPSTPPPAIPERRDFTKFSSPTSKEVLLSRGMSLTDFVKEYSKELPVQIKVLKGYCGPSSRLTISSDDMYNIHLVKHAEVVRIKDAHGIEYSVPLNSSVEFGLVYDPVGNLQGSDMALTGYKLQVCNMLESSTLPKVVCCLNEWKSDNGKLALSNNELLIIKGVHKARLKSKLKKEKGLKVVSFLTKEEMTLSEDCGASFSTNPSLIKMLIPDIMEHIQDPFPCVAMMHLSAEIYQNPDTESKAHDIPDILLSRMIYMNEVTRETSLIASTFFHNEPNAFIDSSNKMIDIPLEGGLLDIEVALVEIDETEKLYDDTRSIYERYNPLRIKPIRDMNCDRTAAAQSLFFAAVRKGWEKHGIQLDEPSSIYTNVNLNSGRGENEGVARGSESMSLESSNETHDKNNQDFVIVSVDKTPPKVPPKRQPKNKSLRKKSVPDEAKEKKGQRIVRSFSDSKHNCVTLPRNFRSKDAPLPLPRKSSSPLEHSPNHHGDVIEQTRVVSPVGETQSSKHTGTSPKHSLNNDSLLEGSVSSCEELYDDGDAVFADDELPRGTRKGVLRKLNQRIETVERRLRGLDSSVQSLQRDATTHTRREETWEEMVKQITKRIQVLEELEHANGLTTPTFDAEFSTSVERNRTYLKRQSQSHVLDLLEVMDLCQYRDVFKKEQISGDILLELSEDELKNDLGIESRLHRIRLMKIVNGQHSVQAILSGTDPYSS